MRTTHAAAAAGQPASMAGESASTPLAERLLAWAATHGRRGLPWQSSRDPYRVWLSEVMLQQTQVATVIGYYERFSARFPTVAALAAAAPSEVMASWAGLGYYSRARNLHACARRVVDDFDGAFPRNAAALTSLPGIGRSTAAAIAALCFDERVPILDGNVKRVLARHFAIDGYPGVAAVERELWDRAASLLPQAGADMPAYTQAIMDLGAGVCTRRNPRCEACPLRSTCAALRQGRVGSLPVTRPSYARRTGCWCCAMAGFCSNNAPARDCGAACWRRRSSSTKAICGARCTMPIRSPACRRCGRVGTRSRISPCSTRRTCCAHEPACDAR